MANLFDLPPTRSTKGADSIVVNKSTNKKSAPVVVKGGGLIEKIASIKALVERKLGKYRNDYLCYKADCEDAFKEYIYNICQVGRCAFDTETTGLDPLKNGIVGFSLYSKGQKGLYVPLHHRSYITLEELDNQLPTKFVSEQLQKLVDNHVEIEMHNAPFDIRVAKNSLGIYLPCWFDTQLAGHCLNENESHKLKDLHSKYVLEGKEDEWSFGKLFEGITFDLVPIDPGFIYAARDAVDTDELADFQLPFLTPEHELCKEQGLEKVSQVFWNIEMPYIDVLVDMEETGISINVDYAQELSNKYHALKEEKLSEFYKTLDMYRNEIEDYKMRNPVNKLSDPISVSSPTQLAILFYDILKIEPVDPKLPRGTGEEILEKIDNPLCKLILEYRTIDKLLGTYIDKLPECINPKTNKVHCTFKQYGAKTGRMSSENPNMQNIPAHNKDIRKMFVASDGYFLMSSDFSQQEPKVMTAMCGDPGMIRAYEEGKDLYAQIASISFNMPYEECLEFRPDGTTNKEGKERRSQAKSILLGILYSRGINSVAEQLHTTKQKAQKIQDSIFKGFPAIKKFEDDTIKMAQEVGYVTTFWGRKRRLPDMQLDEFEFKWAEGYGDIDPLSFDTEVVEQEVPWEIKRKYISRLKNAWGNKKRSIVEEAKKEGIIITDNGGKIADATRQCVNSRIQGSAADMTKIAGRIIFDNKRLRELGFRLLVPIHDEYLAECPIENAKECAELFNKCMCEAARDLHLPMKTDVEVTKEWYGDSIDLKSL